MRNLLTVTLGVLLCAWAMPASAAEIWRESTFEDFRDGTFGDGGVNTYVSAKGRIQTIYRHDANNDGYIDLVFANPHSESVQVDMSIYWGNGKDYSIRDHSYVPAWGPDWATPADLDGDGNMDLVVANYNNGTSHDMDAFVYYGGLKDRDHKPAPGQWASYPFKKRVILPIDGSAKAAVGDLNRDGNPDIVCAREDKARIFWGQAAGQFNGDKYTDIDVNDTTDVAIENLNNDKWPDVVFCGPKKVSYVYWGSKKGPSGKKVLELATEKANAVEVADIDNDGKPDLVFANQDTHESWAYLNRNGKFSDNDKIVFETHNAKDCVAADFNQDGFADVFFTNHDHYHYRITNSFLYFGSKGGFSKDNRQNLLTIGAWGVSADDLNRDGWPELVVSNHQEHNSWEVPSFVYWNSPDGFDHSHRTPLFEHGAKGNAIADFNGDGNLDILIVSTMTTTENEYHPNYIYWGNEKGLFSPRNRLSLPGIETQWGGMADFDDDGQVDIIFSNHGEGHATKWGYMDLFIYWNQNNKFDFNRRTGLPTFKVHGGLLLADIDKNGYIDIIVGNEKNYPRDGKFVQARYTSYLSSEGDTGDEIYPGSFIYWGGPYGYVLTERSELPATWCRMPGIADLDRDGNLDIVFGNEGKGEDKLGHIFFSDGTRNTDAWRHVQVEGTHRTGQLNVADLNRDGFLDIIFTWGGKEDNFFYIYYGDAEATYSIDKRVKIEGVWAKTMSVADVDEDGWPDLLCSNYWHPSKPFGRDGISHVLLGGPDGYSLERKISLPTTGGDGTMVSDFNFDGYKDIFWASHRRDGDFNTVGTFNEHVTDSYLYWGGPGGFKPDKRLNILGRGMHFRKSTDEIGHIYNRGYEFDYISSPYNYGQKKPLSITWKAEEPHRSSVRFQLRIAKTRNALEKAPWRGPAGKGSYFTKRNDSLKALGKGSWIQYRAVLDTFNGAQIPVLNAVEIAFE
ncbi:MAG: FG-GAP repeat domain-containing protein [Planctomycetota bacterium]